MSSVLSFTIMMKKLQTYNIPTTITMLNCNRFYNEYHGHRKQDLVLLHKGLSTLKQSVIANNNHSFVFLVGDSSCDNKYWLEGAKERAVNGYEQVLADPKTSTPDIAHCMNQVFAQRNQQTNNNNNHQYTVINCAVEESTISDREDGKLTPQDEFVRDHLAPNDIVVVSLGGNDVALKPTTGTIAALGWLSKVSSTANVKDGSAWGLGYFHGLFHQKYNDYLKNLTSKCQPKMIIPSMIYYLDENPKSQSWANKTLDLIGYNTNPGHIQAIIHRIFVDCMINDRFKVPGVKHIAPIELSKALDGKDPKDYDNRVEPSVIGGRKMAAFICQSILEQVEKMSRGECSEALRAREQDDGSDDDCGGMTKKKICKN